MDFFKVLILLDKKGYKQLYLRSWYFLRENDLYYPSGWDSVTIYSGDVKLALMENDHKEWKLSLYPPQPCSIQQIDIPPGCIELDPLNRLTLGVTNWDK